MKIFNVSHYYIPHVGGLEVVASMQVESQLKSGHEVSIVTCAAKNEISGKVFENSTSVYKARALNITDSIFSIPFPIGGFGLIKEIYKGVFNSNVVNLHDVFYQPSWVAYLCAKSMKKPLVLTQHVGMVDHSSKFVMWVQKLVYKTIGRKIFEYANTVVVYNPYVRDFLLSEGVSPAKILLTPNGIKTSTFNISDLTSPTELKKSFNLPVDRPLVLFVGRLVPKKGYDILYEARTENFDLVYVGSGDVPAEWLEDDNFHFLGSLSQVDLAKLYRIADVFVSPTKGEIFTLVMQEAMASGVPVISCYESGYEEYDIDRNLLILCDRTAEALKENILNIINNKMLGEKMSKYSLALSDKLCDWDNNVRPLLNVYESLVTKQSKVFVTTSWDDGHVLDIRLAEILKKYGIKGTFYVSPNDCEFKPEDLLTENQIRDLAKDFEIGAHTMTHRHLTTLSLNEADSEITESKEHLEKILGNEVSSFCYPAGKYSAEHVPLVMKAGYKYGRTVERFSFNNSGAPFETKTSVHTYNHYSDAWALLKLVRFNPVTFSGLFLKWDKQAMFMFDQVMQTGGVFHLWGHSWELDKQKDWERLEKVLTYIGGREGVKYITNREQLSYGL